MCYPDALDNIIVAVSFLSPYLNTLSVFFSLHFFFSEIKYFHCTLDSIWSAFKLTWNSNCFLALTSSSFVFPHFYQQTWQSLSDNFFHHKLITDLSLVLPSWELMQRSLIHTGRSVNLALCNIRIIQQISVKIFSLCVYGGGVACWISLEYVLVLKMSSVNLIQKFPAISFYIIVKNILEVFLMFI